MLVMLTILTDLFLNQQCIWACFGLPEPVTANTNIMKSHPSQMNQIAKTAFSDRPFSSSMDKLSPFMVAGKAFSSYEIIIIQYFTRAGITVQQSDKQWKSQFRSRVSGKLTRSSACRKEYNCKKGDTWKYFFLERHKRDVRPGTWFMVNRRICTKPLNH